MDLFACLRKHAHQRSILEQVEETATDDQAANSAQVPRGRGVEHQKVSRPESGCSVEPLTFEVVWGSAPKPSQGERLENMPCGDGHKRGRNPRQQHDRN